MESRYEELSTDEADFIIELMEEVVFFVKKLKIEDTQFMRRAFCRSVFQFVDGIASDIKAEVMKDEAPTTIGDEAYLALQDKKIIGKGDKKKVVKKKSGFAKNIDFAFDIYGWTNGIELNLKKSKEWQRFQKCIAIRNRVVHPKTLEDMRVSDHDMKDMLKTFTWLREELTSAREKVAIDILNQIDAMRSAFFAQHTSSQGLDD